MEDEVTEMETSELVEEHVKKGNDVGINKERRKV